MNFFGEQSEKPTSFTMRIDKNTLDIIKRFSKSKQITINSAVNQLLKQGVEWDLTAAKAGWIPMPKIFVKSLFDELTEKKICEKARESARAVSKDMMLTMRGNSSVSDWLSIMNTRSLASGFYYSQIDTSNKIRVILRHDLGYKFSLYFDSFYREVFESLDLAVETDLTDTSLIIYLPKAYLDQGKFKDSLR